MARRKVPFPFPPLPKGEFHPRRELADRFALIKRDAKIVRWFIEDEMELDFGSSPLRPFLDA